MIRIFFSNDGNEFSREFTRVRAKKLEGNIWHVMHEAFELVSAILVTNLLTSEPFDVCRLFLPN